MATTKTDYNGTEYKVKPGQTDDVLHYAIASAAGSGYDHRHTLNGETWRTDRPNTMPESERDWMEYPFLDRSRIEQMATAYGLDVIESDDAFVEKTVVFHGEALDLLIRMIRSSVARAKELSDENAVWEAINANRPTGWEEFDLEQHNL